MNDFGPKSFSWSSRTADSTLAGLVVEPTDVTRVDIGIVTGDLQSMGGVLISEAAVTIGSPADCRLDRVYVARLGDIDGVNVETPLNPVAYDPPPTSGPFVWPTPPPPLGQLVPVATDGAISTGATRRFTLLTRNADVVGGYRLGILNHSGVPITVTVGYREATDPGIARVVLPVHALGPGSPPPAVAQESGQGEPRDGQASRRGDGEAGAGREGGWRGVWQAAGVEGEGARAEGDKAPGGGVGACGHIMAGPWKR